MTENDDEYEEVLVDSSDSANGEGGDEPSEKRKIPWWAIIKWTVIGGFASALIGILVVGILVFAWTRDLPSTAVLQEYRPPVMTRVHAGDGKLIAEYARERRVYVPIESIPKDVQQAFVAAEDQRFYDHGGVDWAGFIRASLANIPRVFTGERMEGASTITMQVAKNFLTGDDYSVKRKVRQMAIAMKMEDELTKDQIMELYLNDIYFGRRSYGIAAASLNYFGKSMDELALSEAAYLAVLPKAPNNYKPEENYERAMNRRNYVLGRMVEDGYISESAAETAKGEDLIVVDRLTGEEYLAAEYFVEEVRREVLELYGDEELYSGGLSIRTTLDTSMQLAARRALREGLETFDRRHGYRGPLTRFETLDDWKAQLTEYDAPSDVEPWVKAVVISATDGEAQLGLLETELDEEGNEVVKTATGTLPLSEVRWAREPLSNGALGAEIRRVSDVLSSGDVILVEELDEDGTYGLRQVPEVNGAILAMDPNTGRVLAMVGGYSFRQSQFNRATQAFRQPGSAFKPFAYMAALDNGFTPVDKMLDAPFVIAHTDPTACGGEAPETPDDGGTVSSAAGLDALGGEGPCFWKPGNYSGEWNGEVTLRRALEKSLNAVTVRLANEVGIEPIKDYAQRFGIVDDMRPELAAVLGAQETTPWRMALGYAAIVNGGKRVEPTIIDRVQDGNGNTIYKHDTRDCPECNGDWETVQRGLRGSRDDGLAPILSDEREEIINPVTAYQMTSMLEGVVQRGTAVSLRSLGRPVAGKTGTTNDFYDAWFVGFSPDLVVSVYVGYDTPRTLGPGEAGGRVAGPVFKEFMGETLERYPLAPFRIPEGVKLVPVDSQTGDMSFIGAPGAILEAFRPGTEPGLTSSGSGISVASGGVVTPGGAVQNDEEAEQQESELDDGLY